MSFIKMAVAGVALCATATVASAQGGPPAGAPPQGGQPGGAGGPGGGRAMAASMMFEGITLNDAQQSKVDSIQTFYGAERKKLVASEQAAGTPGPDIRAKVMELSNKMASEIRTLLTADQQKLFDANAEKRKEAMQNRQR
jgi:Spy/CpxP family protein refolding chaperone